MASAKELRDQAAALIQKHGYGRRVPDLAVLDAEIDPCLETFQTACAKVGAEGWWHLMPRLQALAAALDGLPKPGLIPFTKTKGPAERLLEPLRKAERAYHVERDAYLKKVEKEAPTPKPSAGSSNPDLGAITDAPLVQLPPEIIQQIATQTGAPADWRQWPADLKAQVVQAIMEAQEGEG